MKHALFVLGAFLLTYLFNIGVHFMYRKLIEDNFKDATALIFFLDAVIIAGLVLIIANKFV